MLSLDDQRWQTLNGGYRFPFDPRPLLLKLNTGNDTKAARDELWGELHHQGDVGEASYAAAPHLVRIYRQRGGDGWNTFAIFSVIELARGVGRNPDVPKWMEADYFRAIRELAEIAAVEILQAKDLEEIRAMLSILAISAGSRTHARFVFYYSAEELLKMEKLASGIKP